MKVVRILKILCLSVILCLIAGAVIIYPERYLSSCFKGFALWAECVLPSLFPFMVITLIFIKSGFAEKAALPLKKITGLFRLPPAAAVLVVISLCSGYPAGCRAVTEFYENGCIGAKDCKKLCALCSTSGPLFILGSVGVKMLADKSAGWKILLAHAVCVLVSGLAISIILSRGEKSEYRRAPADGNVLYNSFYGAVISVAVAGGFIAFFCVAAQIFCDFNLLLPIEKALGLFMDESAARAACKGLVEVTCGLNELAATGSPITVPLAGFMITFGGASILMQQYSYLAKAKVGAAYFIGIKFLQGVLCFCFLLAIA